MNPKTKIPASPRRSPRGFSSRVAVCIALGVFGLADVAGARNEEIRPPFGLAWQERAERLTSLLRASRASITEKRVVAGREAWTVEGLVQPGLRRTIFYFSEGSLVEIELQYEHANWDSAKYNTFLNQVKRRIEDKHGPGRVVAQSADNKGDVSQTVLGYQWDQELTSLQLFYFAAERQPMAYRTVSLHYRAK